VLRTEESPIGLTTMIETDLGGSVWLHFSQSGSSTNRVLANSVLRRGPLAIRVSGSFPDGLFPSVQRTGSTFSGGSQQAVASSQAGARRVQESPRPPYSGNYDALRFLPRTNLEVRGRAIGFF
jgi:hypothetical protein